MRPCPICQKGGILYSGARCMALWASFYCKRLHFKADIKSYKPLETAAIFFLANLFLKQGISSEYVTVVFICTGQLGLQGAKTTNIDTPENKAIHSIELLLARYWNKQRAEFTKYKIHNTKVLSKYFINLWSLNTTTWLK